MHLSVDNGYDGIGQWPESRCFSIQNPPDASTLKFTYSVKGAFTSAMEKNLYVGDRVWLKLPYGSLFSQPHNKENTVFISGGTGVTPFLSLFNDNSFNDYKKPVIYLGFRSKHFNIYKSELAHINNKTHEIKINYEDVDGRFNISEIFDKHGSGSSYFISGPPMMIKIYKEELLNLSSNNCMVYSDDWE